MAGSALFAASSPASATCAHSHENYEGQDAGNPHDYGNAGDILVSDIPFSSLESSIHRSLFVMYTIDPFTGRFTNDAEVGWTANNGGYVGPHPYFEWVEDGVDHMFIDSQLLGSGSTHTFKVADSDGNGNWKGYIDGNFLHQSDHINTPYGRPITNSERRNTCDPVKAHFTNLKACSIRPPCSWSSRYNELSCYFTDNSNWEFDKVDNTEHWIDESGVNC